MVPLAEAVVCIELLGMYSVLYLEKFAPTKTKWLYWPISDPPGLTHEHVCLFHNSV
jgi:hypothetical protein